MMKTNVFLALFMGMVLQACAISVTSDSKDAIVPSKNYITQKVKVEHFEGISTSSSIDVKYTQTNGSTDVEVYAPDNLMEYVKLEVEGGMLKIFFYSEETGKGINIKGKHNTEVRISAPAVHALRASSSGDIFLMNGLQYDGDVSINSSSSGDIKGGNILCKALETDASSSGDIELENVECTTLVTEASSAGDISIESVKAETVSVEASSSGDVSMAGVCRSAKFESSSAGDIEADELKAEHVIAKASSAGDITCHATESLEVSISSAGNVSYKGNPKQIKSHPKGLKKLD